MVFNDHALTVLAYFVGLICFNSIVSLTMVCLGYLGGDSDGFGRFLGRFWLPLGLLIGLLCLSLPALPWSPLKAKS